MSSQTVETIVPDQRCRAVSRIKMGADNSAQTSIRIFYDIKSICVCLYMRHKNDSSVDGITSLDSDSGLGEPHKAISGRD